MLKIGIITIIDYNNYGNRLQNYALQETLKKLNVDVLTIVNNIELSNISRIKYFIKNNFKEIIIRTLKKININSSKVENKSYNHNRRAAFNKFTRDHINESEYIISEKNLPMSILSQFDYFIAGSDQIWNPRFRQGTSIDFLTFAEPEKRISYSASFGTGTIPEKYRKNYQKWLADMNEISVRERSGAKIVKELVNRDVPVMVDPTLLLTKEEWLSVSKKAENRPNSPYLLTYFLGGPSNKTRLKLEKIAKENNMTVINLGDITERETYETGPSEFLDYINNASAFFTDSFHGVVFSIIFETPFVVYERQTSGESMYSRIETILDNFDMRNREADGFDQDIFSMDFSGTYEVIEREYNKSIKYLKEALRIEE